MRVLIFMTQFYQLGGAERLDVELAEELNRRGIHADILSMYTEDLPGMSKARDELLRRGIPAVFFLGMRIRPPFTSIVPAIVRLRRLIRRRRYDFVETSATAPTVLAAWATRGTKMHHLAGLHHVFRQDRENQSADKVLRFSVRCNHHIRYYGISECVSDSWIRYSHVSPSHTRRVYNAISDAFFEVSPDREGVRQELGIPANRRIVIYVGRLAAYKGIETLLDAVAPILSHADIHLLYVGAPDLSVSGTKEALNRMKERIQENGWQDSVQFLPYREDVPRLLASADVLAHPTQTEGFGLTLVEAMAAGLPVVASNVEGIPEVLSGTDSIMVPPNDPQALREAVLKTLHRSPQERTLAITRGRNRAEYFRQGRRTDEMLRLFRDVMDGRF